MTIPVKAGVEAQPWFLPSFLIVWAAAMLYVVAYLAMVVRTRRLTTLGSTRSATWMTASENASPGVTEETEAAVSTVGSSGEAGAVSPTLGPSAGSSARPLALASAAALFQATMLTYWGGTLTLNVAVNDWPEV